MISTVTQLNISETSNSIDGTDGDWTFVSGEKYLYIVNNKDGKKYKNISASVRSMLSKVCDDLKFKKQIVKTKHLDGRVTESVYWERLSKAEYKKVKEKSKPDMVFEISSKNLDEILTNK